MMNGIDVSHWQKGLDLGKIKCDFVIAKATEGTNYVDPCFASFMRISAKLGKCMGMYHFARPEKNSAIDEAKFFYEKTKDFYGKAIPVLDWESSGKANVKWAKEWLDTIYSITGVKPMIYMSEAVANAYDWSEVANADYGLWIAKYRDMKPDKNYDMTNAGKKPVVKWWKIIAMWQWTSVGRLDGYSGNLDCDVFYGDVATWNAYANKTSNAKPEKETPKPQEAKIHIVQKGETLSGIAKKYKTSVNALVKKNNIKDKNKIYVGQKITI